MLASLGCSKDASILPSASLQNFLGPLITLCGNVRSSLGLAQGVEAEGEELKNLLQQTTEASVKEQIRKVAASKVVQANWAGKKSAFPGEPKVKVHIHGYVFTFVCFMLCSLEHCRWIHDIATGKLRDLGATMKPPE